MPILPSAFARECVEDGWEFGVHPHYMLAVARFRSHIVDDTDGDRVGPFRLTKQEWDANRTDKDSDIDFLPTDITGWRNQCAVFALMSSRTQDALIAALNRNPSVVELYEKQWPAEAAPTLTANLQQALDDTASLLDPAVKEVLDDPSATLSSIKDPGQPPPNSPPSSAASQINLSSVAISKRPMATKILDAFAAAGYGKWVQVAALANAIAESNLNPNATSPPPERSYGLFQVNLRGLGAGRKPAELKDPDKNIAIIVAAANGLPQLKAAGSIEQAVGVFVSKIERPADKPGETVKRIGIARQLLG